MTIKEYYNNLPVKVQKILKGAMIALLGLLATFLEEQIPLVNFGDYAVYMVALNAIFVNSLRLYIAYLLEKI
jgi:hypothetical protein